VLLIYNIIIVYFIVYGLVKVHRRYQDIKDIFNPWLEALFSFIFEKIVFG